MGKDLSETLVVIGPDSARFPGGIALFSTQLTETLSQIQPAELWSWSRPYPSLHRRTAGDAGMSGASSELDIFSPSSWHRAAARLTSLRPRAVLINWVHPLQTAPIRSLLRSLKGIPSWVICHNVRPHEHFPAADWLTRFALAPADGLIVHGEIPEEGMRRLLPGKRIVRLFLPPLGSIDILSSDPAPPHGGEFRLLFFGHVRPYKGLEKLLMAFAIFLQDNPRAILTIAGKPISGSLVPGEAMRFCKKLRELARRLKIESAVQFRLEYIPEEDLAALFAATHLAVLPFKTATSSASLVTLLAWGLPTVVSRMPEFTPYVREGENGFFAEPGDVSSLAAALEKAVRNLPRRKAVSDSVKKWSWAEYARLLLHEILGDGSLSDR